MANSFYSQLASEIVRVARGRISQSELNKRMQLTKNTIHLWESGKKRIEYLEFLDTMETLDHSLAESFSLLTGYRGNIRDIAQLLNELVSPTETKNLMKFLEVSQPTYSRWLNGKTPFYLDNFLGLIDFRCSLISFVEGMFPDKLLPSLEMVHVNRRARHLFAESPLFIKILECLSLESYKNQKEHRPGVLSEKLGISLSEEIHFLQRLLDAGVVEMRDGRYTKSQAIIQEINAGSVVEEEFQLFKSINQNLLRDFAEKIDENKKSTTFGFVLIAADDQKTKLLEKAFYDYSREVMKIASAKTKGPANQVIQLNFGMENVVEPENIENLARDTKDDV